MTIITKYRPEKFEDVIGQDPIVRSLLKAIEKGTSRTFMLTGPSGVGKTTLARLAAKALGCHEAEVNEVDGSSATGIDDMRNVSETMRFRPLNGDFKAIIVDEAHALSQNAVKSLLKATEEPPEWGCWFLCTTEPGKMPKALVTRCVHFTLKPVDLDDLQLLLEKVAKAEKIKVPGEVIKTCAHEAQGSPRQALVNLVAVSVAKSVEEARELLHTATDNPVAYQLAQALLKGISWRDCQAILRQMKELNGESVRQVTLAYMTTCALSIPGGDKLDKALAVLEAFEQPCNSMDRMTPIVLRCARLLA